MTYEQVTSEVGELLSLPLETFSLDFNNERFYFNEYGLKTKTTFIKVKGKRVKRVLFYESNWKGISLFLAEKNFLGIIENLNLFLSELHEHIVPVNITEPYISKCQSFIVRRVLDEIELHFCERFDLKK